LISNAPFGEIQLAALIQVRGKEFPGDPPCDDNVEDKLLDELSFHLCAKSVLLFLSLPFIDKATDIITVQLTGKVQSMGSRYTKDRRDISGPQKVAAQHRKKYNSRLKMILCGYLESSRGIEIYANRLFSTLHCNVWR
jgi:hypothetical protein|tara:strand:- start:466 stop:879 length:414 start_codon:yes stop_codon:yes gene_type:complete